MRYLTLLFFLYLPFLSSNDGELVAHNSSINIFKDSVAVRYDQYPGLDSFNRLGDYVFEIEDGLLKSTILSFEEDSINVLNSSRKILRVVQIDNGPLKITDGNIIINFLNNQSLNNFEENYPLSLVKNISYLNIGIYKLTSPVNYNTLFDTLRNDSNIKWVELNILDPYQVPQ